MNRVGRTLPSGPWAEDAYGTLYWERVPSELRSATAATKRRKYGEVNSYGHDKIVEVNDDEALDDDQLFLH